MRDGQGLEVTTGSGEAVAAIDLFREELLSIGPRAAEVIAAADALPGVPMLEGYAAACGVFGQTSGGDALCRTHLDRAAALGANERELAFLAAVEALLGRRHEEGARRLEAIVSEHPRDLVSAKLLEFTYYLMGQEHAGPRFLAAMDAIADANRGDGLFASMHSFALELTGRYAEAIDRAEEALAAAPVNPWADHTLAHALLKSGRVDDGIAVLARERPKWDDRAPFIRGHNAWHLALLRVETLDHAEARRILDEAILPPGEAPLLVQYLDAISLLWRIEMAGGTVDAADWARMADASVAEAGGAYMPFQSAHLHFALARAGREAELAEARRALAADLGRLAAPERRVWETLGLPLLDGVAAFARGDAAGAAAALAPVEDRLAEGGGSDAQVDLFRQTLLLALVGSGERSAARGVLERLHRAARPTPLSEVWRALC